MSATYYLEKHSPSLNNNGPDEIKRISDSKIDSQMQKLANEAFPTYGSISPRTKANSVIIDIPSINNRYSTTCESLTNSSTCRKIKSTTITLLVVGGIAAALILLR